MDSRPRPSVPISLFGLLVALVLLGAYSFPRHPLQLPDLAEQGGYDYFYFFATTRALEQGLPDVYLGQAMADFSRELSRGRWEIHGNHPLSFYIIRHRIREARACGHYPRARDTSCHYRAVS